MIELTYWIAELTINAGSLCGGDKIISNKIQYFISGHRIRYFLENEKYYRSVRD